MAPFLGQIGRREIDGDAVVGERQADRVQRGAHALAGFAHRLVGEADNIEHAAGAAARSDMHLHIDLARPHAFKRNRIDMRETHARTSPHVG